MQNEYLYARAEARIFMTMPMRDVSSMLLKNGARTNLSVTQPTAYFATILVILWGVGCQSWGGGYFGKSEDSENKVSLNHFNWSLKSPTYFFKHKLISN